MNNTNFWYEYPNKNSKTKRKYGLYTCVECGNEYKSLCDNVKRRGYAKCKSCSCKRHGLHSHNLYSVHGAIKQRCFNPKHKHYQSYGGRGISMSEEWVNDFMLFYEWSMRNGYKDGLSIDRVDNNKGYSPNNCRYTTQNIQTQNTRLSKNNKTGVRGVRVIDSGWQSRITWNKKTYYLGVFKTKKLAAEAFDNFVIKNNTSHTRNFS